MSELKAYYPYANRDGFYHKSEVDKFITDLEESHKMEVEQLLMEIVKLKALKAQKAQAEVVLRYERTCR